MAATRLGPVQIVSFKDSKMPFEIDVAYALSFTWCGRHILTQKASVDSQQAPESGGRQATDRGMVM